MRKVLKNIKREVRNNFNDRGSVVIEASITLQQLKDFQKDPNNFRLELPSENRGHGHEDKGDYSSIGFKS